MSLTNLFSSSNSNSGRLDGSLFALKEGEVWWRDRYSLLESRGYRLRERLRPGWVPSWTTNPRLRPEDCEDSVYNYYPQATEATRISDRSKVFLKRVAKNSNEKSIAVFLSSQPDDDNHCIPIIETFGDDIDHNIEFIVMPLLRKFDSPPFHTVDEVVDFMRQTLKGIAFIHSRDVAHRDCSDLNVMLDGNPLYPDGFHPIHQTLKRTGRGTAKFYNRSASQGVKYYFTDFGLSTHFISPDEDHLVRGRVCQVDVPELSDDVPYDPFAVDIYLLGDVYKRHFIKKYVNVQFLSPLVESMIRGNPIYRPNGDDALKALNDLVSQRPDYFLRWRLIDFDLGRISRFIIDIKCIGCEGFLITKQFFGTCQDFLRPRKQQRFSQGRDSTG